MLGHLRQQHERVGARIRRVGVGEQLADIARARRAEQRVGNGMRQLVGVGVAQEALMMRNVDAAQNELAVGRERMDVEAQADTRLRNVRHDGPLLENAKPTCR